MNETNSECDRLFRANRGWAGWETFRDSMEYAAWLSAWNHQQAKITSLQSDNQKLREALEKIAYPMVVGTTTGICFTTQDDQALAKAALAETKQEEKDS